MNTETIDLDSVELLLEYSQYMTGEDIVWVPDAMILAFRRNGNSGENAIVQLSSTSLEHLFLLLDQIEEKCSGHVLFGTGGLQVVHTDDCVVLKFHIHLTGSTDSMRLVVESLISETFFKLQQQDTDTRHIATQLTEGRFSPWTIDPLAVHDRLMNGE